jgi:uncharacterized membrane protein YraQ (UPF0718 family)
MLLYGDRKKIFLVGLMTALIAVSFWGTSRYPSLDNKATMGGDIRLEDGLSFEVALQVEDDFPAYKKVAYSTVNWISTNRQGMTFGILIAAAIFTLLQLLGKKGFKNSYANTVLGVFIGAPLGVCVNCAAPIAKGLNDAGARLETTLTTMFSSPTLNVVVVTMVFSIFPFYIAVLKLSTTFFFLLVVIPLLCKYVFANETLKSVEASACMLVDPEELKPDKRWAQAVTETVQDYFRNLWYIVKTTVPLMLLAGFLGTLVVTLLPLEDFSGVSLTLWGMLAVAAIGVFLPCPIAFDIIVASALLTIGVPVAYVMALLITLGTYSIYPMMIMWKSVSPKVALTLLVTVALLGVGAGMIAERIDRADMQEMMDVFDQEFSEFE